jgi:ribosomal protein S18 acetylase RimI-like enzyme
MVLIRPMSIQDRNNIVSILNTTPEFEPEEIVVALELIDYYLSDGTSSGYHQFTATDGDDVVGYICFGPTPLTKGTWDIYWMAVKPDRKGQGIGKALIEFTEGEMREHGGRLSIVETSGKPSYEKTRLFYFARGYEVISRIADFYTIGDDKLIYQKRLL